VVPDDLLAYVRAALPAPPARVLEVGAGDGELARALGAIGYAVVAIDPAPGGPEVEAVALHELQAEPASFDAAVAVLSLHHVEPLELSCRRLAALVRPGGAVVVDEFDIARFDARAAAWWIAERRTAGAHAPEDPEAMVAGQRSHLHPLAAVRAALAWGFDAGEPVPGPYLHRWGLDQALRPVEVAAIARGELPATGARLIARRR
jgi:SAM-dependent methyltransferase